VPSPLPFLMLDAIQYPGLVRRIKSGAQRNGLCRRPRTDVVFLPSKMVMVEGATVNQGPIM